MVACIQLRQANFSIPNDNTSELSYNPESGLANPIPMALCRGWGVGGGSTHLCTLTGRPEPSLCLTLSFLPYYLETDSPTDLETVLNFLPASTLQCWSYGDVHPCPQFYVGAWDSNSGQYSKYCLLTNLPNLRTPLFIDEYYEIHFT